MLRNNVDGTLRSVTDSNGKAKKNKNKKSKERETEWTWKEQVDLVKFTKSPIQASLLRLETSDLNKLALEGFLAIMKYMGDYPMAKGQSEVDSVYTILMVRYFLYSFDQYYHYKVGFKLFFDLEYPKITSELWNMMILLITFDQWTR